MAKKAVDEKDLIQIVLLSNGLVAAFDKDGKQVHDFQLCYVNILAEFYNKRMLVNLDNLVFETPDGRLMKVAPLGDYYQNYEVDHKGNKIGG